MTEEAQIQEIEKNVKDIKCPVLLANMNKRHYELSQIIKNRNNGSET